MDGLILGENMKSGKSISLYQVHTGSAQVMNEIHSLILSFSCICKVGKNNNTVHNNKNYIVIIKVATHGTVLCPELMNS